MGALSQLHAFLSTAAFPARWDRVGGARPIVEIIGLLGIAVMAFTLALGNTGQSIGMGSLILASLLTWPRLWRELRTDWVARMVLLWFGYVLLRTFWAIGEMPELASEHLDQMRSMARVLLFPLACWWLGGTRRSIISLCMLVMAGAVVGIWYYGYWSDAASPVNRPRLTFGGDPRMEGLLYVSILAGMLAFVRPWCGPYANRSTFFTRALLWLLLYLLVLWALIAVEARAAWLAGVLTGLIFLAWFVGRTIRRRAAGARRRALASVLILLVGTSVIPAIFVDTITDRMLEENANYRLFIDGEVREIEDKSLASRLYTGGVGWRAWLERPFFGWGPGSSRFLVLRADIPSEFQGSSDLHNNYLDVLVRFGLVGALLFFGFWFWLVVRFARGLRAGKIPGDLSRFVLSVSLIFFMVNFTDTYIEFQFGWFYMVLLCAMLHSYSMRPASEVNGPGLGKDD